MSAVGLVCLFLGQLVTPQALVLEAPQDVWDVLVEDINGDGHVDVVAFACDSKATPMKKNICVFLARPEGGFATAPSWVLGLDPEVGAAFFAETDGAPPRELIAVDAAGAVIYRAGASGYARDALVPFVSLLPSWNKRPIFLERVTDDLDGDGLDEWFIPVPGGYTIRTPAQELARVTCDAGSRIKTEGSVSISHSLPLPHTFAVSGEPAKALAFLSRDYADFAHGPNWAQSLRFDVPGETDDNWSVATLMDDIDGDGLPDIVVTRTRGRINISVETNVFLATAPFTYSNKPTYTFSTKGAFATPILDDLNGDGKLDLVFLKVPYGLKFFVNFFVRNKLGVTAEVYEFGPDGFSSSPTVVSHITIDAPDNNQEVAYTLGDFNGDGRKDVAFGPTPMELAVHTGSEKEFVSSKPWLTVAVPTAGVARAQKLNGNETDDIVIFHPGAEMSRRIDVVLF